MLLIPDEFLIQANITESELRHEVAAILYSQNKLSFGQARSLAQLNHFEFQKLLDERGIALHYTISDLNDDISTLREMNRI